MGPPPFGDGNNTRDIIDAAQAYGLQWGHRLSRWKPRSVEPEREGWVLPSMGPPPFGDGNLWVATPGGLDYTALQWGHRLSAMETK